MPGAKTLKRLTGRLAVGLALAVGFTAAAHAAPTREDVREQAAEAFGAEVLRMEEATLDGRAVWLVTLMRQGGDDNAAFSVDTVAFDAETGEPLRAHPPRWRGSGSESRRETGIMEKRPEVLRDRPWR
jgi:hypothetical protein